MSVESKLTAIAEAIREKTGKSGTMTLAEMPGKIQSIHTGGNIQSEKTVSITANGTHEVTPDDGCEGMGKVTVTVTVTPKTQEKSVTPRESTTYVTPDGGYDGLSEVTVTGDANLVAANIKKGVSIFGVIGSYEGYEAASLSNAAGAEDVLVGKEIMLPDGTAVTGTYQPPQSASTEAANATISYEYDPETDTLTIVQTPPLTE